MHSLPSVRLFEQRLLIAKEFGDRAAERRAYCNLGNAYIFLGEFEVAAEHYKYASAIAIFNGRAVSNENCQQKIKMSRLNERGACVFVRRTLQLARQLKDRAVEAQACYSLGNTYTLLQDYERAIDYHLKHLIIAQDLNDR